MAFISGDSANIPSITLERQAGTPSNAPTGKVRLFIDDTDPDNFIKLIDESGTIYAVGTGGLITGAAPDDAEYILKTSNVNLANAFDLSALETGRLYVENATGDLTSVKDNLTATNGPTVNDDSGDGYSIGSFWLDTAAEVFYVCTDATVGAAVWIETGGGGGGGVPEAANVGDLIVGGGVATYNLLGLGSDGQFLAVNLADTTYGMEWRDIPNSNSYDRAYREIVPPEVSGWTEVDSSGLTPVFSYDGTNDFHHISFVTDDTDGNQLIGLAKTRPLTANYTIYALLEFSSESDDEGIGFGIFIKDSNDIEPIHVSAVRQSSITNGVPAQFGEAVWGDSSTFTSFASPKAFKGSNRIWLRLRTINSGNDLFAAWSPDGIFWSTEWWFGDYNIEGQDQVGFCIFQYNPGSGAPAAGNRVMINLISWEEV
jgi:hypothetical protein